jgi:hypothetical protein
MDTTQIEKLQADLEDSKQQLQKLQNLITEFDASNAESLSDYVTTLSQKQDYEALEYLMTSQLFHYTLQDPSVYNTIFDCAMQSDRLSFQLEVVEHYLQLSEEFSKIAELMSKMTNEDVLIGVAYSCLLEGDEFELAQFVDTLHSSSRRTSSKSKIESRVIDLLVLSSWILENLDVSREEFEQYASCQLTCHALSLGAISTVDEFLSAIKAETPNVKKVQTRQL